MVAYKPHYKKCQDCGGRINMDSLRSRARHGLEGTGHITFFDIVSGRHLPMQERYL